MLLREIKKDLRKWEDIPCFGIEKCNIAKMSIIPKLSYKFNAIAMIIPARFICRN